MNRPLRPTWVEVDLGAIGQNVRALGGHLSPGARLMAVVKADAYGHGAVPVAHAALRHGAAALGVATVEEGVQLRDAGIGAPILVLGAMDASAARTVAGNDLTQTVFDPETVHVLATVAKVVGKQVRVHMKVDTGMGRIGVRDLASALALADVIDAEPSLVLEGMFTHFAASDAEDLTYTQTQYARFLPIVQALRARSPEIVAHACNSAGLIRCPEMHLDMARAGIALYVPPQLPQDAGMELALAPAMRWVTRAVHVKTIEPGETVSYGCTFTATRPTRVMTLPVGYADGYHRAIGGKGYAIVRGQRAPVIGRVCMDQAMLDVTDVPGAAAGDPVVLLGAEGGQAITAAEMGQWCGMIDYEVVLSPSARVPRIITGQTPDENKVARDAKEETECKKSASRR